MMAARVLQRPGALRLSLQLLVLHRAATATPRRCGSRRGCHVMAVAGEGERQVRRNARWLLKVDCMPMLHAMLHGDAAMTLMLPLLP
jgi:hypothetical protein